MGLPWLAQRAGLGCLLARLSGLSDSSERISSPTNQTNQIDEIDQMNQHSLDSRRPGPETRLPTQLASSNNPTGSSLWDFQP